MISISWPLTTETQVQPLPREDFKLRYFQKFSDFRFAYPLLAVVSGSLLDLRTIIDQTIIAFLYTAK